jgi:hypothetical protein
MKIESRTNVNEDSGLFDGSDNAVSGDRTAQAQRDTSITDTTDIDENLMGDARGDFNRIDQEIATDFQNFKQNLDQWVDRLSANANNDAQRYD